MSAVQDLASNDQASADAGADDIDAGIPAALERAVPQLDRKSVV